MSRHLASRGLSGAIALLCLGACGPGKSGTDSDTSGTTEPTATSDPSGTGTTTSGSTTGTSTPTTSGSSTTTGGGLATCADAETAAECAMAAETDPNLGAGCRWGEVRVAMFDDMGGCSLAAIGGTCELATFDEGGPGCFGFFRPGEDGAIELVEFGCGSPLADEWELCFDAAADTPEFAACACLTPDG